MSSSDEEEQKMEDALEDVDGEVLPDPTDDNGEIREQEDTEEEAAAKAAALLEELSALKDEGNAHFKAGANGDAVAVYERAINAASLRATSDEAKETVKPVLVSLHSNLAAARLRLENWEAPTPRRSSVAASHEPSSVSSAARRTT
jgi:hypothetical protein